VVLLAVYQLFRHQSCDVPERHTQTGCPAAGQTGHGRDGAGASDGWLCTGELRSGPANDLSGTARIHVGTANAVAAFGSLEGAAQSEIFLLCQSGTTLLKKVSTNTADAATLHVQQCGRARRQRQPSSLYGISMQTTHRCRRIWTGKRSERRWTWRRGAAGRHPHYCHHAPDYRAGPAPTVAGVYVDIHRKPPKPQQPLNDGGLMRRGRIRHGNEKRARSL